MLIDSNEAELDPDEEKKKEAEFIEKLVRQVLTEINKTPMGWVSFHTQWDLIPELKR